MGKQFEDLKEGFEDVLAYRRGKITLRSEQICIPEPPIQYTSKEIKKIRERHNYSQGIFAKILNVSLKTVQAWESGIRSPSHAALRLLEIIDNEIYLPKVDQGIG